MSSFTRHISPLGAGHDGPIERQYADYFSACHMSCLRDAQKDRVDPGVLVHVRHPRNETGKQNKKILKNHIKVLVIILATEQKSTKLYLVNGTNMQQTKCLILQFTCNKEVLTTT